MKEKINQTAGRLKQTVRAVGVGIATLTASFFMSAPAYAAGVQDSQIVKGTEKLVGDVTTWLMVLAPVVAGLLIIYFCIRRGMADEMDQKKWNNRIVVAVVSCIGAVLGSATLNLILGYYTGTAKNILSYVLIVRQIKRRNYEWNMKNSKK